MEYVTLVNRTSKPLRGTWNGRQFDVSPGETMLPGIVADAVKRQNPLMGSVGSEVFEVIHLCGIKELGDDITPIEQSASKELMNSKILHGNRAMETIDGVNGMYRSRASVAADIPAHGEVGFEKP
jgi:hypothetical protein